MRKNKSKSLKQIVKKMKNEASKSSIPDSAIHTVGNPIKDLPEFKKAKAKNKKPQGELPNGKKEEKDKGAAGLPEPGPDPGEQDRGRSDDGGAGKEKSFWPWD